MELRMFLDILSVIIGILGTIALSETMSFTQEKAAFSNSTTAFLLGVLAVCMLRYVYHRIDMEDKRGRNAAFIYSAGLAFCLTAGKQLQTVENFSVGNPVLWVQLLVLTAFFTGLIWYLFQWLNERTQEKASESITEEDGNAHIPVSIAAGTKEKRKKDIKFFLLIWLIIFICWIPVFLAFYPGAFVYDAQDEYVQVASRIFTTHHPLTHVLLLGGFVCLGNKLFASYNIGIAMYTLFQMAVLSGVFSYTVLYIKDKIAKQKFIFVILFYGFFPVIPMYAVCSAKDTLFTAAFLIVMIQLLKLFERSSGTETASCFLGVKKNAEKDSNSGNIKFGDIILLVLAATAMMLLRNNGVYAYICLIPIAAMTGVFLFRNKKDSLLTAGIMLLSLVLYFGAHNLLIVATNASHSENQEILTVPIQQLTRTYVYSPEVFSKEDVQVLYSYIPEDILRIYDADLSDLVKANFNNEKYNKDSHEFWSLWGRMFLKKPVTYLNAWLMTSYGYWYPDTIINVYGGHQRFTFQYGESSYFGFETEQPGTRDSKFPWLEEQYRKLSLEIYQQNVPVISMLFSPGFLFWVFLGCFFFGWYQKKYSYVLSMTGILLLWLTVLLGPTFLVRYVLILWFAMPVILLPVLDQ